MEQKKIMLITIIALITLTIFILILRLHIKNNKTNEYKFIEEQVNLVETLEPVKIRNSYYAVEKCVNKFYMYYKELFNANIKYYQTNNEGGALDVEKNIAKAMYNMLDKEYINEKEVTTENIKTKLSKIKDSIIHITDIYVSQKENNIEIYLVKGIMRDKSTGDINQIQLIIKIDTFNTTFSIIPQEYVEEKYSELTIGEKIEIENLESIEKNENNMFKYVAISDETYIKDLLKKFENEIIFYKNEAYNNLNQEYKNKKFTTLENFQDYIKDNIKRYYNMELEKYQKTQMDDYTQYVCIDQNGNYYIFRETSPFKYTVMLDTYTLDLPDFIQKYNNATEQEKVALNIDKFIQAINGKDYKYAYNCLADAYKNNYFKTQQEFESYAKQNFYGNYTVEYKEFNLEGDVYTYSLILTDKETGTQMNKTFIMKLEEGTKFVLSFNV